MFKKLVQNKLEKYVRLYFRKHPDVKLVIVTGSVGKTGTKIAIGTVLTEKFRVRLHSGNHNAEISTPLAILGIEFPDNVKSISSWLAIFRAARERLMAPSDIDVIVQEIGSDRIGQVPHVGTYIHPDIAVVTAISPEHMEYFVTIDEVAKEELAAANLANYAIINSDDIDGRFAQYLTNPNMTTYGINTNAEYYFIEDDFTLEEGYSGNFVTKEWDFSVVANVKVFGEQSLRTAVAAFAVATKLGMNKEEIARGLANIRSVPGRMNILRGVNDTIIIDDSYNSSPLAAKAALKALYSLTVPQRVAVLGSMNELGESSASEHKALGKLCDSSQLAWVITVGEQAEKYLAPAAKARGCQVKSFRTALEAGSFIHQIIEPGAVILFKGSEGSIYLEEAIKVVLHSTQDEEHLVRQSATWMKRKKAFFSN